MVNQKAVRGGPSGKRLYAGNSTSHQVH